ncbi:MAG: hypothetical protein WB767_10565 [Nocardioides sp.]
MATTHAAEQAARALTPQLLATQVLALVVTIVVMLGVGVGILLFERRRAERIRRDLTQMSSERDAPRHPPRSDGTDGSQ